MRLSFSGSPEVIASRPVVWQHLMDPQFVAAAAPGVEKVERVDDTRYKVFLAVGMGAIKIHFTLDVELSDVVAPERVTMRAHGKAPGSVVDLTTVFRLVEAGAGRTSLAWQSDCDVSGLLANFGGHLIEGTARKLTEQFWLDFADRCARAA